MKPFVVSSMTILNPPRRTGAFAILELVLALLVIAVLTTWYFNSGSGGGAEQAAGQYEMSINRANNAACTANRTALRTQLQLFQMQNAGKQLTTETLEQAGIRLNTCPEGGAYSFSADEPILCSKHE